MIRKTLLFIALVLAATTQLMAVNADWYKYPLYCDDIDEIVETDSKVYYLSGGNLFSFSPSDQESYAYDFLNVLNDKDITSLYYNPDKGYLIVVYSNSNMDLIYDNGRVVNLPEIKDSSVTSSKTINDINFGEDRIAIATDFGFVLYDDNRLEVIESGIYNKALNTIAIMNGYLLIYGHYLTDYTVMYSPLEARHNSLDKFKPLFKWGLAQMRAINDEILAFKDNGSKQLFTKRIDFETLNAPTIARGPVYDYFIKTCKDGYYTLCEDGIITFEGSDIATKSIPEVLKGQKLSFFSNPDRVWTATADGIAQYDISSSTPTVLHDRMLYPDFTTVRNIGYMRWSPDKKRLYISRMQNSGYRSYCKGEGINAYQTTNYIEDGHIVDVSLKDASAAHERTIYFQEKNGNTRMYGDATWMIEDPDDTDRYYCGNFYEGLYVIKRNPQTGVYEEIGKFTEDNSPITANYGQRALFVDIDKDGNLWMGHQFGSLISILPAAKRLQDPKTITKADWRTYTALEDLDYSQKDFMAVICKKSNMVFFSMAMFEGGFVAIDTKGTLDDPSDDTIYRWNKVTDQDGNQINFTFMTFFIEDQRGCVWVGTNAGVFEITNPSDATNPNMRVRRIKVPRNDGTNYADYLLDSDAISYMCVDPSDRKWIATENSGLFLVSETGDAILQQYTMDNSPLMSNVVWSVECDPNDNTVYVGTEYGLLSFKSDSAPGHDSYSEIYAYPNPVRPDYSGVVTITGLMDHSVVKITDASGSVVYETRSEGGMATWNACNASGERVRSGVYYVYASQSNNNSSVGAVTKIMVIK